MGTTTSTSIAPTTTTADPLEFVDGTFLGIGQGSRLADAAVAFGLAPVRSSRLDRRLTDFACTAGDDPWVIHTGGLTLVFFGSSADVARLSNWRYVGGPVAGFDEMIAPNGIRIGDTSDKLETLYPDFTDLGDELSVYGPPYLRFGIENGVISYFGVVDCSD